ncbi:hypothetical protein RHMOL_Rhmol01G0196600 [Rhododendron molle]|uniref:Uncharacterized protein n=1 Tax=Rhododendron molle TaxID=49168 RepID=A0ACC0Q5B5_RHOML|nr:hypothetical protein RHMOL_Rhmol01G0196600 [Rhododendron molle]
MDARLYAYFTNLLQDGVILEDHSEREPQDEFGFTYADALTQVFTQASQTLTQKGSTPKRVQHGGKFTIEEDKLLVSAYLNVSLDVVQGNDQKLKTYWRKCGITSTRTCQWLNVSEANKSYKELHGGLFQFEHCWNILKYQPKWHVDVEKKNQRRTKLGQYRLLLPPRVLIDIKEEQKKTSDKKMDIVQQLHVQEQERHQLDKKRLREEQERNAIKKEMLHMKQFKEARIMLLDTSALPHVQQEYYQSRQMEIVHEWEKRFERVGS